MASILKNDEIIMVLFFSLATIRFARDIDDLD